MNTITDYKIVFNRSAILLSSQVQKLITKGWQPHGPLTCGSVGSGPDYHLYKYQAMVKYAAAAD